MKKKNKWAPGTDNTGLSDAKEAVSDFLALQISYFCLANYNPLLCTKKHGQPFPYISSFTPNNNHTKDVSFFPPFRWQNKAQKSLVTTLGHAVEGGV